MIEDDIKVFGFWVYLMTDLVLFGVLFATYIVLHNSTFGGFSGHELFNFSTALAETLILLTSSFTCALGMIATRQKHKIQATIWFVITMLLGAYFLYIEISEFSRFVKEGASWEASAFLSSFFTLVGTHGFHISVGLLWMAVAILTLWIRPLTPVTLARIFRMALFWHFLDFVWIFIFTTVYAMGHLLP